MKDTVFHDWECARIQRRGTCDCGRANVLKAADRQWIQTYGRDGFEYDETTSDGEVVNG